MLPLVRDPFDRAREVCAARLGATDISVHVIDAPGECIPEQGLGGYTYGPEAIVLAVDPDHDINPAHVLSTLVHEIHHAMRWRGPGCGSSLAERLITEGLAQLFEREVTGVLPAYAQGETTAEQRTLAMAALGEDPADEGRWFYGSAELPRWFGYRFGYELAVRETSALDLDAAALVVEPAETFLSHLVT